MKLLLENIKWTTDLGNAFMTQQADVMEAVVEQANPQVVYVPSYNPTVVYGVPHPAYAYPPVSYPPTGCAAAGMAISFGVERWLGLSLRMGRYGCALTFAV